METEKLYYSNGKLSSFTATVLECREAKDGWDVVLDRTAFYPEGGGQPCDRGTLERLEVLDVQERKGCILHRLEQPLLPGTEVRGQVDLARRFDYAQQHTADHILTGVIHRRYGLDNVGFHMGKESTFIDLNGVLDESALFEMERVANEAVWMDLPVEASWPDDSTLARLDYRSKKALTGPVRIVTIPGIDVCACCGTHVEHTGAVGLIKILSVTRLRGGVRVEYAAGRRAYHYLDTVQQQNRMIYAVLSARPLHTAEAVRRLLEERDAARKRCVALEQKRFEVLAQQQSGQGDTLLFEEELNADGVRRLADAVKETCGGTVLVFSGAEDTGYQYALAAQEGNLRPLGKALNEALNGRGGGREDTFLQGSVRADRTQIEAFWRSCQSGSGIE